MKPGFLGDPALRAVFAALPEARVVGGAVRDYLCGRPVSDFDLATPATPDDVTSRLEAAGIRVIPTGLAHGTVTALPEPGRPVEITTLRRDVATDGRHAEVEFTDDWLEDAARRDFTINAMGMAPDGTLYDPFGGAADLRTGVVRFVGKAEARVAEDYLRVLRYFRFLARYGAGEPNQEAIVAINGGLAGLAILSPERVWGELLKILAAPDPSRAVALMAQTGVLAAILPEGAAPEALKALIARGAPADPLLRFAALMPGFTEATATRLRLANAEAGYIAALLAPPTPLPGDDDATLRRLLADTDPAILTGRTWLAGQDDALRARIAAMPIPEFPLAGRDALALGAPPGPAIGEALRQVRAWWLAGGCTASAEQCRAELARSLAR